LLHLFGINSFEDFSNTTHFGQVTHSQSLPPKPADGVAVTIFKEDTGFETLT
jgi:hypothetical protein